MGGVPEQAGDAGGGLRKARGSMARRRPRDRPDTVARRSAPDIYSHAAVPGHAAAFARPAGDSQLEVSLAVDEGLLYVPAPRSRCSAGDIVAASLDLRGSVASVNHDLEGLMYVVSPMFRCSRGSDVPSEARLLQ